MGEQECVAEHVWAVLQNIRGAGGEGETVMQEHTDSGLVLRQLQKWVIARQCDTIAMQHRHRHATPPSPCDMTIAM